VRTERKEAYMRFLNRQNAWEEAPSNLADAVDRRQSSADAASRQSLDEFVTEALRVVAQHQTQATAAQQEIMLVGPKAVKDAALAWMGNSVSQMEQASTGSLPTGSPELAARYVYVCQIALGLPVE
jgi:hypothetical protein